MCEIDNITIIDYFYLLKNFLEGKIRDLIVVRHIVKNWHSVLLFRFKIIPRLTIILRNGKSIRISSQADYASFWKAFDTQLILLDIARHYKKTSVDRKKQSITLKFMNRKVKFGFDSEEQLVNTLGMIKEQFFNEEYKKLDVKNATVIDIGANIGDTAIYFAMKGAKHVYAFEPYPYSYEMARGNIINNNLTHKVSIFNEGCGRKSTTAFIDENFRNYGGSDLKNFKKGREIKITTLEKIVKRFGINNGILKIDCEGCEYSILLKSDNKVLGKFKQIQIEYHYGYKNLVKKLNDAGFTTKITRPRYSKNELVTNKRMVVGFIYAKKTAPYLLNSGV